MRNRVLIIGFGLCILVASAAVAIHWQRSHELQMAIVGTWEPVVSNMGEGYWISFSASGEFSNYYGDIGYDATYLILDGDTFETRNGGASRWKVERVDGKLILYEESNRLLRYVKVSNLVRGTSVKWTGRREPTQNK